MKTQSPNPSTIWFIQGLKKHYLNYEKIVKSFPYFYNLKLFYQYLKRFFSFLTKYFHIHLYLVFVFITFLLVRTNSYSLNLQQNGMMPQPQSYFVVQQENHDYFFVVSQETSDFGQKYPLRVSSNALPAILLKWIFIPWVFIFIVGRCRVVFDLIKEMGW